MDVYTRLARKLNRLPHGFPATESGVELKILRKIFSPEDAAFAVKLRSWPQSAETIARRHRLPLEQTRQTLDEMVTKGQILGARVKGERKYAVVPFVVGIYEFQLNRMDKELTDLVEEYLPTLIKTVGGHKPAVARVIPVTKDTKDKSGENADRHALAGDCDRFEESDLEVGPTLEPPGSTGSQQWAAPAVGPDVLIVFVVLVVTFLLPLVQPQHPVGVRLDA